MHETFRSYITSARRSYEVADHYRRRGVRVVLGGLHVTSLPDEASVHADTIFLGPGEDTWPAFLRDLRAGRPRARYVSTERTLVGVPPVRRDLIKRHLYLVPNSIVVSRGCPHVCDFCYKEAFFEGGRSFYTQPVDQALAEIDRLPGKHLSFLDDHLLGNRQFATELFAGMRGMGRLWQAASTVKAVLQPDLLERAVEAGLRSLFVGFERRQGAPRRLRGRMEEVRAGVGSGHPREAPRQGAARARRDPGRASARCGATSTRRPPTGLEDQSGRSSRRWWSRLPFRRGISRRSTKRTPPSAAGSTTSR